MIRKTASARLRCDGANRMKAEVHALSMKTYTPEKWAQLNGGDLVNNG